MTPSCLVSLCGEAHTPAFHAFFGSQENSREAIEIFETKFNLLFRVVFVWLAFVAHILCMLLVTTSRAQPFNLYFTSELEAHQLLHCLLLERNCTYIVHVQIMHVPKRSPFMSKRSLFFNLISDLIQPKNSRISCLISADKTSLQQTINVRSDCINNLCDVIKPHKLATNIWQKISFITYEIYRKIMKLP